MLIKSVKLENIRSYVNQTIKFPGGSVLLSGDIGSGKSSVLLAVEFALFGIRGKQLSGNALLRNGANSGSVELNFELDGKDIILKRTLKRGKDDVQQDSGYLIIDGKKNVKTAVELKASVLEMLGYPKDLLKKTKNLIYRYTVYTPQEEMKQILVEDTEERLDTLRRVFGIERYKIIKENACFVAKQLRDAKKIALAQIADLEDKQKQRDARIKEIEEVDREISEYASVLAHVQTVLNAKEQLAKQIEGEIKELNVLKNQLAGLDADLRNKKEQLRNLENELARIDSQAVLLEKEIEKAHVEPEKIKEDIAEKNKSITECENELKVIRKVISELEAKKAHSMQLKQKISVLGNNCPTCQQAISEEHKNHIILEEDKKIFDCNEGIELQKEHERVAETKLNVLKNEVKNLEAALAEFRVFDLKRANLEEKKKQKDFMMQQCSGLKTAIEGINSEISILQKKMQNYLDAETRHDALNKEIADVRKREKEIALELRSLESKKMQIRKDVEMLDAEIKKKLEVKEKSVRISETERWLDEWFVKVVDVIEKHVMARAHAEFSELFNKWFRILVEDEGMSVRLDDGFTPIIEQNGYETSYEHLSGGERTAAALAYRLALNRVINDMMSGIKTKDLIILDEPTDGFSSEQLDRMRDVLEQLNARQVIIVSHEGKVEGFVDNVIRIEKNEHESVVVS